MTGPLAPRVVVAADAANYKKASSRPPSFRPKRSGVEKSSPSDGTGGITAGDLSTQSIIGAVTVCPIPARSPTRDDGGGGHPYRHFDRSEAEWRNLTPLMTEKLPPSPSFRRKRCGVEKSPSSDGTGGITEGDLSTQSIMGAVPVYLPYRYVPPLEMTVAAGAPIVISTEAKRSGEISRHYGT